MKTFPPGVSTVALRSSAMRAAERHRLSVAVERHLAGRGVVFEEALLGRS